jgi:hypothetical protein
VWRQFGIGPHRSGTFTFSTDPELHAKVRDIVGLYLHPPERAVVLCVDEKSQIQALDRTAPILPLRPGLGGVPDPRRRPARHGTTTLFAALEVATGRVVDPCFDRHRTRSSCAPAYHNRRYAALAQELLLDAAEVGDIGWSDTRPTDQARELYAEVLTELGVALTLWRRAEGEAFGGGDPDPGKSGGGETGAGGRGRPTANTPRACVCACPRRIRAAPSVLAQGPIRCLVCATDFTPA